MANILPWPGTSDNLVWQFFTSEGWPNAKCNSCNNQFYSGRTDILERHLWQEHPKIIEKIQDEIIPTWLSQCFIFDIERCETRCIIENCSINVFHGINHLRNHLLREHNINEPKENANTTADDHWAGACSQATVHQNRPVWNFDNLIWRYFTLEEWPFSKCNICNNDFCDEEISKLERHLRVAHPEVIKEIQDEIGSTWLSQYFTYDVGSKIRCIIENCNQCINIFFGINYLKDHLLKEHNIAESQGNAGTNIDGQSFGASSQVVEDMKEKLRMVC